MCVCVYVYICKCIKSLLCSLIYFSKFLLVFTCLRSYIGETSRNLPNQINEH